MILSMTGYASSTAEVTLPNKEKMILAISLKSLNSRFFEASCKLPSLLSSLEITLQRQLKKALHRGHVFLHIKIVNPESLEEKIVPSLSTIENYVHAIQIIQKKFKLNDSITLSQILQLPNTLQSEDAQLSTSVDQAILQHVQSLTEILIAAQKKEGLALTHDIKAQLTSMKKRIAEIKKHSHRIIQEKKDELKTVMTALHEFTQTSDEQIPATSEQCLLDTKKSALVYELEKIDINEEIVRFNSHLKNIALQLQVKEPVKGKRLDFTIQELNREINTIGAKCSNVQISSLVIDIKTELEKVREQAQNII